MSDNTELNQGQDGDVVRLLDKGGVKTQVVALDVGGAGGESLLSAANPLPVSLASTGGTAVQYPKIAFSTSVLLANGATYSSGVLSLIGYTQVQTNILSDVNGTVTVEFCEDSGGATVLRTLTIPYVGGSGYQTFSAPAFTPHAEYQFTADEAGQAQFYFDTKFLTTALSGQVLGLNSFISPTMSANLGRNILVGKTGGDQYKNVGIDGNGHLEVALRSPRLPFGSIHTERLVPIFQTDAVYGINAGQTLSGASLSGTATADDASFIVSTGTTLYSQAFIQSRRRMRYRPGQGVVGRFTARYTAPVAYSYQIAGFGHSEDGVYFGYKDIAGAVSEFGILYVNRGKRDIQTMTVTTGATAAADCTITLNSVAFTVPLTAESNIQRTVWEISQFVFAGWKAYPNGATIVFVNDSSGAKAGTFSFAAGTTGAAATIASTRAGAASTEAFYPQSEWNGDKMDGAGASGVTADWTKGNVFQIGIQYLGFGAITFEVETADGGGGPDFVNVHTMLLPNALTATTFRNPSFPFTAAVYSAGSTTDLSVHVGSYAGFIEGESALRGNRFTYTKQSAGIASGAYYAFLTVLNKLTYGGIPNQVVVNLLSLAGSVKDNTTPCTIYLIKNGELAGNPDFADYSSISSTAYDTSATTVTITDNAQIIYSMPISTIGEQSIAFDDIPTLQPGEWISVCGKSNVGTASYVNASLNTREDQ